jgi:hypothetical protein
MTGGAIARPPSPRTCSAGNQQAVVLPQRRKPPRRGGSRVEIAKLAEHEAHRLMRRIIRLESRLGLLRQQRDNLLDWLLREAVRCPAPRRQSTGRRQSS